MKPIDIVTVTVNAFDSTLGKPGVQTAEYTATMFIIKKATGDFMMRVDSDEVFSAGEGWGIDDPDSPFHKLTFFNYNSFPIRIEFWVGQPGVKYLGPAVFKPAPTTPLGNFGIKDAASISKVFGTKVSAILKVTGGNGYSVGDQLTTPDGTGSYAVFQVAAINSFGAISKLNILDPGNYSVNPTIAPASLVGGTGAGAEYTLTMTALTGAALGFSGNWLTITAAAALVIPTGNGTNARKAISFKCKTGSAAPLLIMDAAGNTVRELAAGEETIPPLECSGVFQIVGVGGTATFTAWETRY